MKKTEKQDKTKNEKEVEKTGEIEKAGNLNAPSDDKSKKKERSRSLEDYYRLMRYYYLPLIVLTIFFVVMIFGLVPSINSAYLHYSETQDVKKEVDSQEEKIAYLNQLKNDSNETNEYLASINSIAPVEVTKVAEFQESIKSLASRNDLLTQEAKTRELVFADEASADEGFDSDSDTNSAFQLIEVPSDFIFEGDFEDIRTFLGELYEQDEFIVIEEMNFTKSQDSLRWQLDITLNKYQFQVSEDDEAVIPDYLNVPENAQPNQEVIDFIDEKYLGKDTETE
ncbi:hypothetical protein GF389_04550 [Candidatus Dojkabacteria bacterium]|nr:hypothetical protein [Candidatus Dojkabacteria bacterium]